MRLSVGGEEVVPDDAEEASKRASGWMARLLVLPVVIVLLIPLYAVYEELVVYRPLGLGRPIEKAVLVSPKRTREVRVYYVDRGAAHSGEHRSWLEVGGEVIAELYLPTDVVDGPLKATWLAEKKLKVVFRAQGGDGGAHRVFVVDVP